MGKKKQPKKTKPIPKLGYVDGFKLLSLLFLGCVLTTWIFGKLLSTRHFHIHGVVSNINQLTREISVVDRENGQEMLFEWKESAQFFQNKVEATAKDLHPQTEVVVVYEGGLSQPYFAIGISWKNREAQPKEQNTEGTG